MTDINPAEVKSRHADHGTPWCIQCNRDGYVAWPCEPYRLADALEQAQAELERIATYSREAFDQRDAAQAELAEAREFIRTEHIRLLAPAASDPYRRSSDA